MTLEQMIAWLTIEGWIAYPESLTDCAAAQNGTYQVVVDGQAAWYTEHDLGMWADDETVHWGDMPEAVVKVIFNKIQEHNLWTVNR